MAAGDLPAGFTLDEPQAEPVAALPPGFALDAAPRSSTLPANAGLAKLLTSVAGLPVDTVENVANLGLAGVGTALTAAGKPDLAPSLMRGSVGGSEWLQRLLRRTGLAGLSPDNPNPQSESDTAQYDFVARGGVLPGGAIPAAASVVAEKALGPEWAGVASMAPSAAVAGYNRLRAPTLQRQETHNAVRDDTWAEAQRAGYKVPPSHVNPTFLGNRAEGVAGKAAINQQAIDENAIVTDNLARRAAGLPDGARITEQNLEARRNVLSEPYRQVSGLSPLAANALQRLRDARANARLQWEHYDRQRIPDAQRQAQQHDQQAAALERVLEREAQRHGRPELIPQLREARTGIARTWDVQRALNRSDGHVDPQDLARAYERNAPLTGELETIARFAQAFPHASKAVSRNPTPGVSALEPNAAVAFGMAGQATGGSGGLFAAGVPLAGAPVRGLLLSDIYQRNVARPNYAPALRPENNIQSLARIAAMANEEARK